MGLACHAQQRPGHAATAACEKSPFTRRRATGSWWRREAPPARLGEQQQEHPQQAGGHSPDDVPLVDPRLRGIVNPSWTKPGSLRISSDNRTIGATINAATSLGFGSRWGSGAAPQRVIAALLKDCPKVAQVGIFEGRRLRSRSATATSSLSSPCGSCPHIASRWRA